MVVNERNETKKTTTKKLIKNINKYKKKTQINTVFHVSMRVSMCLK